MNQPLVSIIVPVYGIDRYIGICVEGILDQTYKNLEIILLLTIRRSMAQISWSTAPEPSASS